MGRLEIAEDFAQMWGRSRTDAGKSQEYMAKALGVSKKTIQNWESGLSCPSQRQGFEWFKVLGLQPLPYYLDILYPEFEYLEAGADDKDVDAALMALIADLPSDIKRKLLFAMVGYHGSSPVAILELVVAHLHIPLRDRLNVAQLVIQNYKLADALGKIVCDDSVQPNMDFLENATNSALKQVLLGKEEYTSIGEI